VTDWAVRIGRHLTPEGSVVVPPRIAAWLEAKAGVSSDKRIALRDSDPLAYEVLMALHCAALHHGSATGTESTMGLGDSRDLEAWLTTGEVAKRVDLSDRAIRKMIAAGRLAATKRGGRWLLNLNHIQIAQFLE
jgi:excisionase family DNA binding protein